MNNSVILGFMLDCFSLAGMPMASLRRFVSSDFSNSVSFTADAEGVNVKVGFASSFWVFGDLNCFYGVYILF